MGNRLDARGSVPGTGKRFLSTASIQTSSGALPGFYSMGIGVSSPRGRVVKLTHLHLVTRSRMVELYLHSFIGRHGMMLN
jgi:hypothetical protein